MSKTVKAVKRVMTVMMIGLVAMVGGKAEAHWIVVKGRCVWHSLECYREDKEPDIGAPAPLVELVATPTIVEGLCNGTVEKIALPTGTETVTLAVPRTIIGKGDFTEGRRPNGTIVSRNLEVARIVSDALLYQFSCSLPDVTPTEVVVREWSNVQMNLYLNNNQSTPHSAWRAATCTLPGPVPFDPKNLPPSGTPYVCPTDSIKTCHGNC
jgi:hypothetical protein